MPKLRSRTRAQQKQDRDYLESLSISQKNIEYSHSALSSIILSVLSVETSADFLVRQARQFLNHKAKIRIEIAWHF